MKNSLIYSIFLLLVFNTSCGQNKTNPPQDNIKSSREEPYTKSELKEVDTSKVPMSQVRNIKQAKNGDMLISSFLGVFRYDGTSFTNLTSTISSPSFWDVLEDRKGNLWFATRDSGVYLQPSGQTNFQHFTTKEGLASNYGATHLYEDKAGNIWFGGGWYDARLPARAGSDGKDEVGQGKSLPTGAVAQAGFRNFTTKEGFPNNYITTIIEDKTGKLWIGTRGEAFVYDGKTFTTLIHDGKTFNNVWSIIEDKKGNIWFGDVDGLWRYDARVSRQTSGDEVGQGRTFTKVSQRRAYGIIEDRNGNIWTTGEINPNGRVWALSRYDQKSLYDKMPTVTEIKTGGFMDFLAIMEANDGSIWFGAADGVYRYNARLNDEVGQGNTITDFKTAAGH